MILHFLTRPLIVVGYPVWVGLCTALAMVGFFIALLVFRRLRARRKEHRLIEREDSLRMEAKAKDRGIDTLRAQWKSAIEFLKRSGLKKRGNPLYVLPWYMVIGPSGAGKTSALRSTRLTSFADTRANPALSGTDYCEWSFFDQAIVIDTAGRYCLPTDTAPDKEEWNTLLDLLFKYRTREPLNGLTVALPADHLLNESAESLETKGLNVRKRINELMRVVGSKFPVYLLVTQCDKIKGMPEFCGRLSEQGLDQAMGYLNEDLSANIPAFLEKAFSTVIERLKNMRLIMTGQSLSPAIDPTLFILPETFAQLRTGVGAFLQGAFHENIYQETPLLRGLFFASANDGIRGHFLHDLFAKILPADRSLFVPTRHALTWRRGTLRIGLIAWLTLAIAASGLMSYSFMKSMKNLELLHNADAEYMRLQTAQVDFPERIAAMDRFSQMLRGFMETHSINCLFGFGLRDVAGVENGLKAKLSAEFRHEFLRPADADIQQAMEAMTSSSPNIRFSHLVAYIVGRLTILRERLKGNTLEDLEKPAPPIPFLILGGHAMDANVQEEFIRLYINSIFWTANKSDLDDEWSLLQSQLKRLLNLKSHDPRWLISWAADQNTIAPLSLNNFWGGHSASSRAGSIPGIFSVKGKALIDGFFREMESALNDEKVSQDLKGQFEAWYRDNAFTLWHAFIAGFADGQDELQTAEAWQRIALGMATEDGPYFALLNHVISEFQSVPMAGSPLWLQHVRQVRDLQKTMEFLKYRQALEKLAKVVADPFQAAQATSQTFDAQTTESSPFGIAFAALAELRARAPRELVGDHAVWNLVSGPLEFFWIMARQETARQLQADWESKVLASATGLSAAQALPVLLAKDGPALRFAKEEAGPFMQWRSGPGYFGKESYGGAIAFSSGFFSFLNGAVWVSSVNDLNVHIKALTPETNATAKRIPNVTRLTLHCGAKNQVLASRRLRVLEKSFDPVEQSFAWSTACTDTVIEIDLAGSHLTKTYPGSFGFFAFLHDFKEGKHTFTHSDFPESSKALAELNVDSLTLHYRLTGAPDFAAPKAAPLKIVRN